VIYKSFDLNPTNTGAWYCKILLAARWIVHYLLCKLSTKCTCCLCRNVIHFHLCLQWKILLLKIWRLWNNNTNHWHCVRTASTSRQLNIVFSRPY